MPNKFDRIIQENMQPLTTTLVQRLMEGQWINVIPLPRKVHRTLEREMDSLLQVQKDTGEKGLLHVEWQTSNDGEMCLRMLLYHALCALEYKLPVLGLVIYIGREKLNMRSSIEYENLKYNYRLVDLTELNPSVFLASNVPEEIIMAVLAGKNDFAQKREIIRKILFKLRMLLHDNTPELNRIIAQLEIIGDLRNVQKLIVEEENNMALTYNIERDIRYNQGLEKGLKKGLETGIQKGLASGIAKATVERNNAFVAYLIQNTSHSIEEIAKLVNVSEEFVLEVKRTLRH